MKTKPATARDQSEMSLAADSFALAFSPGPALRNLDGVPLARFGDETQAAPDLLPQRDHRAKRAHESRPWFSDEIPATAHQIGDLFA